MTGKLMRYDGLSDELIPVTQEWVDGAQRRLLEFALQREELRKVLLRSFVDEYGIFRDPVRP